MSSAPASGSLERSPATISKVTILEAPKPSFQSPGKFVEKDTTPAVAKKPVSTSDCDARSYLQVLNCLFVLRLTFLTIYLKEVPPRTLNQSTGVTSGEEAQVKQAIFSILKDG